MFFSTTIATFTSILLVAGLAHAAPTSTAPQEALATSTTAHLPGVPHAPNLHPSAAAQEQKRDVQVDQLNDLMVETKRQAQGQNDATEGNGGQENRGQNGQSQEDDGGEHVTTMVGSPVSFPR